jgi:hypothetical protein
VGTKPGERARTASWELGTLVRRGIDIASWELKTVLAEHPTVAIPLTRLRGHGEVVTDDTEIVIEGFVRSAQSYTVAAFRLAQEPHASRIAHHTHAPSTLIDGVRRGIPALAIVREPEGAILSYLIKTSATSIAGALRGYVRFHRPLLPYRQAIVVGTFPQVTDDLASVIRRVNERFGTSFGPFDPTEQNVGRVFREIEEEERRRARTDEERELSVPRPSAVREELKASMLAEYRSPRLRDLRARADRLYATFAAQAGS